MKVLHSDTHTTYIDTGGGAHTIRSSVMVHFAHSVIFAHFIFANVCNEREGKNLFGLGRLKMQKRTFKSSVSNRKIKGLRFGMPQSFRKAEIETKKLKTILLSFRKTSSYAVFNQRDQKLKALLSRYRKKCSRGRLHYIIIPSKGKERSLEKFRRFKHSKSALSVKENQF